MKLNYFIHRIIDLKRKLPRKNFEVKDIKKFKKQLEMPLEIIKLKEYGEKVNN